MSELKKLKKSVMVDVSYTQTMTGFDPVEIDEECLGSLYRVDDDTYILAFDNFIDGKKVTTTVKLTGDTLSIVKISDVHSRQTFALDEWYASQFFYGGGSVVCRNYTKKLEHAVSLDGGIIEVLYELYSGDTHMGYYHVEFFIR